MGERAHDEAALGEARERLVALPRRAGEDEVGGLADDLDVVSSVLESDSAFLVVKRTGTRMLDLGGIETDRAPGIARFKLGLGAEPHSLVGTYA